MSVETMQRPSEQAVKPIIAVDLYTGAGSTDRGIASMKIQLVQMNGDKKSISAFDSGLFGNPPARNRYRRMEESFVKHADESDTFYNVAHSFGAVDLAQTVDQVEKHDGKEWLEAQKKKLDTVLISPAIPKGRFRALRYGMKALKMRFQEFSVNKLQFPGRSRGYRSINSFLSVLPSDFEGHKDTYLGGLRNAYSHLSLVSRENRKTEIVAFDPTPIRAYASHFSSDKKEKLQDLDKTVLTAMQEGKLREVRHLLHKRAQLIRPEINKIYEGEMVEQVGDEPAVTQNVEKSKEGSRQVRDVVKNMFVRGKAFKHFLERAKNGEKITIVRPEFDILDRRQEINALVKVGKNVVTKIAEFTTHAAPWSPQPGILKRILNLPAQT